MLFIGFPECILADYGSVFTNPSWRHILDEWEIRLQLSRIESRNALEVREGYHALLRHIHYKVRDTIPKFHPDLSLRFALKAMNRHNESRGISAYFLSL